MKFQDYRTVFQVVSLLFVMLAAFPAINLIISFPRSCDTISEFWLLGPDHSVENYPFNIKRNEEYNLFLGVDNHNGFSAYYVVYAKFRNQSQPLPNANNSEPSSLPSIYEFQFFIADGEVWETPVTFEIIETQIYSDSMIVESISLNDRIFQLECSSTWDSENEGFYYQLFFELWIYNSERSCLEFENQFVGIRLNMTI